NKFLNVPVDAVLHPASLSAQEAATEQKGKATVALGEALHQPRRSPEERRKQEETAPQHLAGEEGRRQEAEIKQRADEEERRTKAEEEERRQDEDERRRQEAEDRRRLDEAEAEKRRRDEERPRLEEGGRRAANVEHLAMLKKDVDAWNTWRSENPNVVP